MRGLAIFLCGVLLAPGLLRAQPGDGATDPTAPPVLVGDAPRVDSLESDWDVQFGTEVARRDFKRLRAYLATKQSELADARSQLSGYRSLVGQAETAVESKAGYTAPRSSGFSGV